MKPLIWEARLLFLARRNQRKSSPPRTRRGGMIPAVLNASPVVPCGFCHSSSDQPTDRSAIKPWRIGPRSITLRGLTLSEGGTPRLSPTRPSNRREEVFTLFADSIVINLAASGASPSQRSTLPHAIRYQQSFPASTSGRRVIWYLPHHLRGAASGRRLPSSIEQETCCEFTSSRDLFRCSPPNRRC